MENKEKAHDPSGPDESALPKDLTKRYEILECFSVQEKANTLLALDRTTGARCVVKCYDIGTPFFEYTEPEALKKQLPVIMPQFVAEFRSEEMRCIMRDYIPGETLAVQAKQHPYSAPEIILLGVELCAQLIALHSLRPPIIHRDIKPENVVIRPDGKAVLIDFGISQAYRKGSSDQLVYGTQGFAPPEQYGFSGTDARSDIYSLGILLYWLLEGKAEAPASAVTPLEKVLVRCTASDPACRYNTAQQVKRALLRAGCRMRRRYRVHERLRSIFDREGRKRNRRSLQKTEKPKR